MIWVFPIHSTAVKKNTESSVIFLWNGVLILNGKENKEAIAICFEIRIPMIKNKELLWKDSSKIYEIILIWKKTKKKWFFNLSEYHHQTMGLILLQQSATLYKESENV